jgi:transglutaminase-like putative cysteine protease
MSASHVTVLEHPAVRHSARSDEPAERSRVQLGAFAALALYATLRWGTMLKPDPVWRLLGLVVLAVAVAALADTPATRHAGSTALICVAGIVAILPLAGIPVSWIIHLRISVTANAIGEGLSALPGVLVPYDGINDSVPEIILIGAGVLLLDSALILAFAPRSLGDARSAVAALPLIVLAIVPSALTRPSVPYVHGVILFALLAAFMWGERVRGTSQAAATGVVSLAAVAALIASPVLDPHTPWLNFEAIAGSLGPGHGESFDWSQRYGPLKWPRTGSVVLEVSAHQPDYWKAQDLDVFDGNGWIGGAGGDGDPFSGVDPDVIARWTQTLKVTVRGMSTNSVIAAGAASEPTHISGVLLPGGSTGTWLAASTLQPGDSYLVQVYAPHPGPAELQAAGQDYAAGPPPNYLEMALPDFNLAFSGSRYPTSADMVQFPPFGSRAGEPTDSVTGQPDGYLVAASPYARMYALAHRLASASATPYEYVLAVERYLAHGYTYTENTPRTRYPLLTFLFNTKAGYCQHFAGAMALLLRMGGVPARVSAGFTTGSYDPARRRYTVTDLDAHAWVEAWFPHYGWVTFDPTPAAAPARGGRVPISSAVVPNTAKAAPARPVRRPESAPASSGPARTAHHHGVSSELIALLVVLGLALAALVAAAVRIFTARDRDRLTELERAFAHCGRPLHDGVTLAALEHRFRYWPDAAAYVHALRLQRFSGGGPAPTGAQRRALRERLIGGGGLFARLRALWALPPLPAPRRTFRRRPAGS